MSTRFMIRRVVVQDNALGMWTRPFLPNLMNTVCFLVETSEVIAILFVNYKGRPWMKVSLLRQKRRP
jgi:hypothetical protein